MNAELAEAAAALRDAADAHPIDPLRALLAPLPARHYRWISLDGHHFKVMLSRDNTGVAREWYMLSIGSSAEPLPETIVNEVQEAILPGGTECGSNLISRKFVLAISR